MLRAVVRPPTEALARAIVEFSAGERPSPDRALVQHRKYTAALEGLGVAVEVLAPAKDLPDACFVEDQAVVRDGVAVLARVGHSARRAESASIGEALGRWCRVVPMPEPATLDGGDVLGLGRTLFVGLSTRTNAQGAAFLEEVFAPLGWRVRPIEVPEGVLHLQSVCSPVGQGTLLLARDTVEPASFEQADRILLVPASEAYAANVVAVGSDVLVAEGFDATAAVLRDAGYRLHPVPMSEFRAADGALTCLSLRFEA